MKPLSFFSLLVPTLTLLLLSITCNGLHVAGAPLLLPLFVATVFYWVLFYPAGMPLGSLLLVGLFYDTLFGYELGLSSALLLGSWLLGNRFRSSLLSYNFLIVWGAFSLYSLCYMALYTFLLYGKPFPLFSWGYGILMYPTVAWVLAQLPLKSPSHV